MQAFIPKNLVKYKVVLTYLFLRTISFRHQFWVIGSLNIKNVIKSILTVFFLQRQWRRARRLVHGQSVRPALPVQRAHAARPAPNIQSLRCYCHYSTLYTRLRARCSRAETGPRPRLAATHLISTLGNCCCTSPRMLRRVFTGSSGGVSFSSDVMLASLTRKKIYDIKTKANRDTPLVM